ncbi:MAG TPA: tyrosine--tRNA ligase [Candidatus Rubrimentiphilum sp.]|nr:tyrosine--tRNA ligase [Candidatus Rubrimentiphilum sp.]
MKIDLQALLDGCDHVETKRELEERVASSKPMTVKLGLDPTTPDLHLGHAVVLRKLQQFVDAGHHVTLVIGDFTASIGDPSGRTQMRPPLSREEIAANMKTYTEQASKILDIDRIRLIYNSQWLAALNFAELGRLLGKVTVAQMLDRNDFSGRYASGAPISLYEFCYPVAVAYDSVVLKADVELGGNDQLFNLLMGRHLQREMGQAEQVCMTVPLLEGLDGAVKMSKTSGNYVGLTEAPEEQFGKLMRISDEMIPRYARLAAFRSKAECETLKKGLAAGSAHPMVEKKRLAEEIVARYHGGAAAKAAREYFERTVQQRELPSDNVREVRIPSARRIVDVLVESGLAESKRAAERLVDGNGVRIDGIAVTDAKAPWPASAPAILSVGARKFVKVIPER